MNLLEKILKLETNNVSRVLCHAVICDYCPIKEYTQAMGYGLFTDIVKAKNIRRHKDADDCFNIYKHVEKLYKLKLLASL